MKLKKKPKQEAGNPEHGGAAARAELAQMRACLELSEIHQLGACQRLAASRINRPSDQFSAERSALLARLHERRDLTERQKAAIARLPVGELRRALGALSPIDDMVRDLRRSS